MGLTAKWKLLCLERSDAYVFKNGAAGCQTEPCRFQLLAIGNHGAAACYLYINERTAQFPCPFDDDSHGEALAVGWQSFYGIVACIVGRAAFAQGLFPVVRVI